MILLVDSEGPDQTVQMHRLIWAFSVRIYLKTCFYTAWHIYKLMKYRKISVKYNAYFQKVMFSQVEYKIDIFTFEGQLLEQFFSTFQLYESARLMAAIEMNAAQANNIECINFLSNYFLFSCFYDSHV